jgi:hypothetical protein
MYTEHDYVLKACEAGELLEECRLAGLSFSAEKEELLCGALEKARREDIDVPLPFLNLFAGWDEERGEYYAAIQNMYDPQNLLEILYERLLGERAENPAGGEQAIVPHVEAYLGVIEQKEKISLAQTKDKLKELVLDMRRTLALYEDGEYSEEDLERLSESLDKAYFDPIRELLVGVIVTIAGN